MSLPLHEELVVAYHALHKVYTYLAQCDNDIVAVNLYAVMKKNGADIELKRLAQTGRGADYALPEEPAGGRPVKLVSAAGHAAKRGGIVGFYIPKDDAIATTAFALPAGTLPALDDHLKGSYDCPLFLIADGFASDDAKQYVLVLISRCISNNGRGYWLKSTAASTTKVPLVSVAREHLSTARAYLKWALTHSANHHSPSQIQAWNRLPITSARNNVESKRTLLQTKELVDQVKRDKTKYAAVLFSDIRGFTNLTTKVSQNPDAILGKFLDFLSPMNRGNSPKYPVGYFEAAHKVISFYGGQLDKFMGDGVMGIFFSSKEQNNENIDSQYDSTVYAQIAKKLGIANPPDLNLTEQGIGADTQLSRAHRDTIINIRRRLTDYNHSVGVLFDAVRCGIALISLFDICWRHIWKKNICTAADHKPIPDIEEASKNVSLGVGICGGSLVAGYFGSRWYDQFTVLGDTVNRAQRMESKAGKEGHAMSGKTTAPQLIMHVPVSTVFAGLLEIDKEIAELFKANLEMKVAAKIDAGSHTPLMALKSIFLQDEEREITKKFDQYSVNVTIYSFLVTTKKGTDVMANSVSSESSVEEPAVGVYVEPVAGCL